MPWNLQRPVITPRNAPTGAVKNVVNAAFPVEVNDDNAGFQTLVNARTTELITGNTQWIITGVDPSTGNQFQMNPAYVDQAGGLQNPAQWTDNPQIAEPSNGDAEDADAESA